ncbi:MAG: hypothetical protein IJN88_08560 [Clostridia bacterium]|nr:hypothetical protein [Clostridia bacterium]
MNNRRTVLVCVTAQQSSETLVKAGKVLSDKWGAELEVVSVLPLSKNENPVNPDILENLYQTAQSEGGEMAVYFSDDPIITVCAHIAKRKPLTLVTGFPGANSNDFIGTIHLLLPELPISMIDRDGTAYNILPCETNTAVK